MLFSLLLLFSPPLWWGVYVGKVATLNAFSLSFSAIVLTKLLLADVSVFSMHKKDCLVIIVHSNPYQQLYSVLHGGALSQRLWECHFFQSSKQILIKHSDSSFYFLFPCLAFLLCVIACSGRSHPRPCLAAVSHRVFYTKGKVEKLKRESKLSQSLFVFLLSTVQ